MLKALSLLPLTSVLSSVPAADFPRPATVTHPAPIAMTAAAPEQHSLPDAALAYFNQPSSRSLQITSIQRSAETGPSISTSASVLADAAQLTPPAQAWPPGALIALPDEQNLPTTSPQRLDVTRPQSVRSLPGQLDDVPVFNSNSPELVQKSGILLSTFPAEGMQVPSAHLNYSFQNRFDVFAHHVAKGLSSSDVRTLYMGLVVYNPENRPVKVDVLQGVTYLSQEAPFNDLPSYVANPMGTVFAGPGSRVTGEILQGDSQPQWPKHVSIPAKSAQLLVNVPIPLRRLTVAVDGTLPPGSIIPGLPVAAARLNFPNGLNPIPGTVTLASTRNATLNPTGSSPVSPSAIPSTPPPTNNGGPVPINGRTILMRLSSNGPVYLASLAMYAPLTETGEERVPSLSEWIQLLRTGDVAGPRDRQPTPPDSRFVPRFYYGRVAGVARGSEWNARPTDKEGEDYLSIPEAGDAISYVISSVDRNTFGTGQIQSAPMIVRYPDTAYRAHGNYGVLYNITLPLKNNTDSTQRVAIMLQTPLQDERLKGEALLFRNPPYDQIFFRGTVRLRYTDDLGIRQTRYMHIVQRRGQQGDPLIRLTLPKGTQRNVEVQLIYPPDSTPPQVLTIESQPYNGLATEPGISTPAQSGS